MTKTEGVGRAAHGVAARRSMTLDSAPSDALVNSIDRMIGKSAAEFRLPL
jgi:hypothetical protein